MKHILRGAAFAGALVLAACSSTGSTQKIVTQAEQALTVAKAAGAQEAAPQLVAQAEEKIAMAKNALLAGDLLKAVRSGEQAALDAELASAMTAAVQAGVSKALLR